MRLVRIIAWIVLVASLAEAAWCLALLNGLVTSPTDIDEALHDTYYVTASSNYFLMLIPLTLAGLGIAFWSSRKGKAASRLETGSAWASISGSALIFLALNWLTVRPIIVSDLPRRYPVEETESLMASMQYGYLALVIGAALVAAAVIIMLVRPFLSRRSERLM